MTQRFEYYIPLFRKVYALIILPKNNFYDIWYYDLQHVDFLLELNNM